MEISSAQGAGPASSESRATVGAHSGLVPRLAALEQQGVAELRAEWRRLFRTEPPQLSRDLILRAVAHRLQERVHGGLAPATLRRLTNLGRELRAEGQVTPDLGPQIRPGARLVREWRGRTHTVEVTDRGFEYAGVTFPSLSPIAEAITGAHWSGPRFFGLVRRPSVLGREARASARPGRERPSRFFEEGSHGQP